VNAVASPNPFPVGAGFSVAASGGSPPYAFAAAPSPPNPPGVVVSTQGDGAFVTVPPGTPSGTSVQVVVSDSANPPSQVTATSKVL
jgi:hypothetical protein